VFILFFLTGFVNAQIKVFNGGIVSVGSTLTPAYGCRLQLVGNSVFTENNQTIESAAYIRGLNRYSTASAPDYTWYNNDNTGIFHPDRNMICFTTNGAEVMRLVSNGNVLIGHTYDWGEKLSVNAGNQTSLVTSVNHNIDWKYSQVTYVNRQNSKALAVMYNLEEKF
jgi:hypothetical protein